MNNQEQNYFADLRQPKKGENLHDPDLFRHQVMERIIESRQLQAEPKKYKRVTDWDKVATFAFGLFTVCFWLPVHMVKWLKAQGSIRGTIIKLIEAAMYD